MVGKCMNCGAPLPRDCFPTRRYCTSACRKQFNRRRHGAQSRPTTTAARVHLPPNTIDAHGQADPTPALPDDLLSLSQPEILRLPAAPSIIALVLKAKLELGMAQHRILELERNQAKREETVLDPELARRAARFLAANNNAS